MSKSYQFVNQDNDDKFIRIKLKDQYPDHVVKLGNFGLDGDMFHCDFTVEDPVDFNVTTHFTEHMESLLADILETVLDNVRSDPDPIQPVSS